MRRTLIVFAVLLLLIAAAGCSRHEAADTDSGTVSPATPPASDTSDDTVATQTMEIGEDRSSAEGGVLTDPDQTSTTTDTTATATTTSTAPSSTPPPKP